MRMECVMERGGRTTQTDGSPSTPISSKASRRAHGRHTTTTDVAPSRWCSAPVRRTRACPSTASPLTEAVGQSGRSSRVTTLAARRRWTTSISKASLPCAPRRAPTAEALSTNLCRAQLGRPFFPPRNKRGPPMQPAAPSPVLIRAWTRFVSRARATSTATRALKYSPRCRTASFSALSAAVTPRRTSSRGPCEQSSRFHRRRPAPKRGAPEVSSRIQGVAPTSVPAMTLRRASFFSRAVRLPSTSPFGRAAATVPKPSTKRSARYEAASGKPWRDARHALATERVKRQRTTCIDQRTDRAWCASS
jgi:hypothetical protein